MDRRATTHLDDRQAGPRLVLASGSPRRLDLLSRVGLVPEVVTPDVDEQVRAGEPPAATALRLASAKAARAVEILRGAPAFVIAADTVVAIDRLALGKPDDAADAARMLGRLSGRVHEVHTGFVVLDTRNLGGASGARRGSAAASNDPGEVVGRGSEGPPPDSRVVTTLVRVKPLDPREIAGYIATGEPFGKAGAYAIQEAGSFMVEGVEGSVTNVIGLPLVEVLEALAALGGPRPFGAASR